METSDSIEGLFLYGDDAKNPRIQEVLADAVPPNVLEETLMYKNPEWAAARGAALDLSYEMDKEETLVGVPGCIVKEKPSHWEL